MVALVGGHEVKLRRQADGRAVGGPRLVEADLVFSVAGKAAFLVVTSRKYHQRYPFEISLNQ